MTCQEGKVFDVARAGCFDELPAPWAIHYSLSVEEDNQDTINVVCPATTDGQAVFIPYPYDCGLYYMCEGFTPTLMSCPQGLEFDAGLNVCNWPFAAGCIVTPRPTEPEPEVTTEDNSWSSEAGTTEDQIFSTFKIMNELDESSPEDDDTINVVCPVTTDGQAVFIPYPYDCGLYYMCEGFTPTLMTCPQGLEFDAILNVCNWPFAAGCVVTPRPTEPEPEITTQDNSSSWPETTEDQGGDNSSTSRPLTADDIKSNPQEALECPPVNDGEVEYVADPRDCSSYFACTSSAAKLRLDCPQGLHFDASLKICNWKEAAGCNTRVVV